MPKPTTTWRLCSLLTLAVALGGCAHTTRVADKSAPGSVPATPSETPSSVAAEALTPIATPDVEVTDLVTPVQLGSQTDLLDHIRNGFQLADVNEKAVDHELNWYANNPDYLARVWGRAELYLYYIAEQLDKRGMPQELALLPVIESAFEPYAYSRARATGLWQFIADTGKDYGLKQDWWYDGRRDVVESTRAALDYLQALHDSFDGDWLLAIAAYNCGQMNVQRAINANRRAGRPTDFWNLRLPTETRAYVPKLLAMRRLMANPALYGLEFGVIPNQRYFREVKTGGQIDLQVVADVTGITREEIYELNPAFHRWATDPTGPYKLLLPVDVAANTEELLLQLTPEQRMRVEHYSVARTDTLAAIAARFNTTPALLRELNGLGSSERLEVGGDLRVPASHVELPAKAARAAMLVDGGRTRSLRRVLRGGLHVVHRGDSLYSIARGAGVDVNTLARLNGLTAGSIIKPGQKLVIAETHGPLASGGRSAGGKKAAATAAAARRVTYTVRRGDTLYSISRALQVTVAELLSWNALGSGSGSLHPGQKLIAFVTARG